MRLFKSLRSILFILTSLGISESSIANELPRIPDVVPPGTVLRIGDPATQKAFELTGLGKDLGFSIEWANIAGGPASLEAFRAGSLDGSEIADIPAIHATWTNLPIRVIDVRYKKDPKANPFTTFGLAPGVELKGLADLKGKRIAYSPSQIHGVVVLRALDAVGLKREDVTLIEMPSRGDDYVVALANKQVDVAPLHGVLTPRYIHLYGNDGATLFSHGLRDDASFFYVPEEAVKDPAKSAALKKFIEARAKAAVWIQTNPDIWAKEFYVRQEGLPIKVAAQLVKDIGLLEYPENWGEQIGLFQKTIELLAPVTGNKVYDAEVNFDRRFEGASYRAISN